MARQAEGAAIYLDVVVEGREEGRVLALDPMSRVFGFVVLEGPARLLDWGIRQTRSTKEETTLRKVRELVTFYRPDLLVLEDCHHQASRRRPRVRALIEAVGGLGANLPAGVCQVPITLVYAAFANDGAVNKHAIASIVATRLPALAPRLPPKRKLWMTEDDRFAIFDAAALALTHFETPPGPEHHCRR